MKIEKILNDILEEDYSAFFYTPSIYKNSKSYIFRLPEEIIEVKNQNELSGRLKEIDLLIKRGLTGYGLAAYETGYLLEKKLLNLAPEGEFPFLKFYFFDEKNIEIIESKKIELSKWKNDFEVNNFHLNTSKEKFINDVNSIRNYIAEGDTYQVNYTVKGRFNFSGNLVSLFKQLIFNQSAQYSAFINNKTEVLISLSPELFFQINDNTITAKPMKGTARRGLNSEQDNYQRDLLFNSEKNRAENLMIVDLLRNDLGKISEFKSVVVKELFRIEKYETLFQMISEVKAELKEDALFTDVLKNIFPCGSITGAPKIRTMEIINELETEPRGIYTGAIGIVKNNEAVFNVPIRTIVLNKENNDGMVGLGSGIVWDSDPEKEFEETLLKSEFLINPLQYFEIFETMLVENREVFLLNEHLNRMKEASEYFLFSFDESSILNDISAYLAGLSENKKYRMKIKLNKWGSVFIEVKDYPGIPGEIKVKISSARISPKNKFQYFKTTNRKVYDTGLFEAHKHNFFDTLFLNENDQVCEGAITNIFIRRGNDWITPPVECGILNGVMRLHWLKDNKQIKEEYCYLDDLKSADEIILTNSLRKKIRVDKLFFNDSEFIDFNR